MSAYKFTTRQKIYLPFKRLIDIFGAFVGIFVCFILLWWWVIPVNAIVTKGHPFFVNKRIGKNDKVFGVIKFRSMRNNVDPNITSAKADGKQLTTKFGRFLRLTSIDETIQILNVFVGQMSFIGPRPLIDKDEDHITIELRKKNGADLLRPGLSGYAQIHGRTAISAEDKAKYDSEYVKKLSFGMDFKLFFKTIFNIFGAVRGR